MTTSARIYGNHNIVFTIKKSTGSATAFGDDLKSCLTGGEDKDSGDITFAEAAGGTVQNPTVKLKLIQSTAAGSLWRFLFDNQGEVVEIIYGPHGNASPTAAQPHQKITEVKISGIPELGGEATKETTGFETEVELKSTGTSTLITA